MENLPKILLACPIAEYKDYVIIQWIDHIRQIEYANFDVLLVDNSRNLEYWHKIEKYIKDNKLDNFTIIHYQPKPEERIRFYMNNCWKIIRKAVIDLKYDYWFSLECDVFPPLDIITHFLCLNKKVVCIPYFIGQSNNSFLIGSKYEDYFKNKQTQKIQHYESFLNCDGTLKKGFNTGIGCMLIHNSILKKIPFRCEENDDSSFIDIQTDTYFQQDLVSNNIPIYFDTSVFAIHKNKDWGEIYKVEKS